MGRLKLWRLDVLNGMTKIFKAEMESKDETKKYPQLCLSKHNLTTILSIPSGMIHVSWFYLKAPLRLKLLVLTSSLY